MAIKLADVKGLMVDKILIEKRLLTDDDMTAKYCAEHGNAIITEQGSRKIRINPHKLEALLHKTFFQTGLRKMNPYDASRIKSYIRAISSEELDLIEYVEDK